jgi:hypothetical protein
VLLLPAGFVYQQAATKLDERRYPMAKATRDYLNVEKSLTGNNDAVLVSVESVASLRRAYPNYFLDTHRFVEVVNQALK